MDTKINWLDLADTEKTAHILNAIINQGGESTLDDICSSIQILEDEILISDKNIVVSDLQSIIDKYILEIESTSPTRWRINPEGRTYLDDLTAANNVEDEVFLSDNQERESSIKDPYDPTKIRVELIPFTIFQVLRKLDHKEIDLQPDFQRHVIWDETRQSRLIESILINIPLPAFYLDAINEARWLVVDGLQRLHTLERFYLKNDLHLRNLEFLHELEGLTYEQLPRKYQRRIEETRLNLFVIQPDTPSSAKFTIFYRINTGGLFLTAQEIRHALFQGPATKLLIQLAGCEEFKSATTYSIGTKRMDDRECVLRFIASRLTPYQEYNNPSFDGFLSDAMDRINTMGKRNPDELDQISTVFKETMIKAKKVLGWHAFRKIYHLNARRSPINKALFEAWSVNLVKYPEDVLIRSKDRIETGFIDLMNTDDKFNRSISQGTGSITNVKKRFSTIERLLEEACQ